MAIHSALTGFHDLRDEYWHDVAHTDVPYCLPLTLSAQRPTLRIDPVHFQLLLNCVAVAGMGCEAMYTTTTGEFRLNRF